ncbi:hypothetical protein OTK50_17355 [Bacillus sp. NEAU-CP5]|uniref:hypothetical protein n=1 Tax=Bacillus TaxID=1386 RepID=UPI00025B280D|nr:MULTISPECIES: hypothetical protein [Bacillus]ARM26742.1 hypothetical protein B9C48_02350 [Bacillus vallismortis]ANF35348.1 membrane protein [Bacillus velezensis]ANS37276.1 hypothetical protein A5891_02310 [Bacillus velezensis]ANU29034.1 hypothetical protein A8142_02160 [Bacillus velezensis]APQ50275.1 hypothetical protein BSO20_09600 [Bacillus amyloliquefaciens]
MSVFILFYLWIVPIVIGIFCSLIAYRTTGKKRLIPGFFMIALSIVSLITGLWIGGVNYHVFIGGMFLFGTLLAGSAFPFFFALSRKRK